MKYYAARTEPAAYGMPERTEVYYFDTRAHRDYFVKHGDRYEVHQVDALMQDDCTWYYNNTWKMFEYITAAADRARAFRRALARFGVSFIKGATRTESDGDILEIVDRKTGEPLYAAIPMEA